MEVLHKKNKICRIHLENHYEILLKEKNTNEQTNINDFLCNYFSVIKNRYEKYFLIGAFTKKRKLSKNFKNFDFYNNVNIFNHYLKINKKNFQSPYHEICYNFELKQYKNIIFTTKHGKNLILNEQNSFKSNIDILTFFQKIGIIQFDIEGMSEKEILEMHELMDY